MVTIDNIPIYEAVLSDEGCGMQRISLVDKPAVLSDFQKFGEQKRVPLYCVSNEEKRLVNGVIMRADFPIYRRDEELGEYYMLFRADTIRELAEKYLTEDRQNFVNLMHESGSDVSGVNMVQWFIKDTSKGVSPTEFGEIADGSLFAEFHVTNDNVWAEIKAGVYKGFSLEGVFGLRQIPESEADNITAIVSGLNGKFSKLFKNMKENKIKRALAKFLQDAQEFLFGSVTTDKGVIMWDGDSDLKAGDEVFAEDAEGNRLELENGEYKTEDGKVIVVAEGNVTEIRDDEAEVTTEGEENNTEGVQMSKRERIRAAFEATFGEMFEAIASAFYALEGEDEYFDILEAAKDYAVVLYANYSEDESKRVHEYRRYSIEIADDLSVTIGEYKVVKPAFVPVETDVDALFSEVERLRAEVAKLEAMPKAKPAHTEAKASASEIKTNNRGIARLEQILKA